MIGGSECPLWVKSRHVRCTNGCPFAKVEKLGYATAIFRQVNKTQQMTHRDALEFPDGRVVLLTKLSEGQEATVLQLPAQPTTGAEADAQKRIAYVG